MATEIQPRATRNRTGNTSVILGEDWVSPDDFVEKEIKAQRKRRNIIALNRSPIARRIITFNLQIVIFLLAAFLFLNPVRDSLVAQREMVATQQAQQMAAMFEIMLEQNPDFDISLQNRNAARAALDRIKMNASTQLVLMDIQQRPILQMDLTDERNTTVANAVFQTDESLVVTEFLNAVWNSVFAVLTPRQDETSEEFTYATLQELTRAAFERDFQFSSDVTASGQTRFYAASPIMHGERIVGAVGLSTASGIVEFLMRKELEQVLKIFMFAMLVAIFMSLSLASTIANPISDLAAAAELGRDKNARKLAEDRIRIPDLTARPDEFGRLSGALRGMITALYERLDANEQFAADVAHEIKNPLASLRSAVGTLRVAKQREQLDRLFDVIEHDVKRLDRLVTDISNASRLDSELVKEEEASFDLLKMLDNITEFMGQEAEKKGIQLITDMPDEPTVIQGLEARLAQVFVNIIGNAISFCGPADLIRVWVRTRENRVLVVVEDSGPGIPEDALKKVFKRFYSERPANQFGNNSGLGLAISKQIVEAHGGVIWAENIRSHDAGPETDSLGARFVIGLPA